MSSTEVPVDITTEATLLVDEIVAALVNARIYATSHPRVQDSIATVRKSVAELARESGENPVRIACADGLVVFQQKPLLGASIGASRLLELLRQWGSGGLEFAADVAPGELEDLFVSIAARPQPGHDYKHLNEQLATRKCNRVRLLPPYVETKGGAGNDKDVVLDPAAPAATKINVGLRFYQTVIDLLQNVTVSVCRGGRIDFAPVQSQAETLLNQLDNKDEPLLGLARQDQYDAFTFGHSVRVAILAMNFAKGLTTDRGLLIRIGTAALLHDVGKSLIPFEILHSTKALTAEERRQMNRHAELGAECLLDHDDSDPLAIASAFGHHRSPDGTGYPKTAHCHETPLVTSIVKICDVFEALTAARPYKQPMSPIRAYRVMLAMGDKLDRKLLRKFIELNGIYPVGQLVELDNGDVAVVRAQGKHRLKPVVELVESELSPDFDDENRQLIDLSNIACVEARSILRELTPEEAKASSPDRRRGRPGGRPPDQSRPPLANRPGTCGSRLAIRYPPRPILGMHSAPLVPSAVAPAAVRGVPSNVRWTLAAFVLLGLVLRSPLLDRSVWFDEVCMSGQRIGTWPQLLAVLYTDIHPPLFVLFMYCWNGVFGDSEVALRMPALLAGLLSIPLTYWSGYRLVGPNAALWAAALLMLSPVHIWYSAEARLYAPMLACTLLSIGTFDRLTDRTLSGTRSMWTLHFANIAVMLALHYYLAVFVALTAVAAPMLAGWTRPARRIVVGHAIGLLLLGGFVAAKSMVGEFETSQDYLRAMSLREAYLFTFDWCWTGHTLLAVDNLLDDLAAYTQEAIGVALVAFGLVRIGRSGERRQLLVPLAFLAIPVFLWGCALVGFTRTYMERTAIASLPFVYLMAGCGLAGLPQTMRRCTGALVLLLCIASLIALHAFHDRHWTVYKPHPDWRSATAWFSDQIGRGNAGRVIFTSVPNPRSLSYYDARIQDVKNLTPNGDAAAIGASVRRKLGDWLGDRAESTFREFAARNERLLTDAALRVHRSASDPTALRPLVPQSDGICYLLRDHWHPHVSEDHTIEDLLKHPNVQVLESAEFVALSVWRVRLLP